MLAVSASVLAPTAANAAGGTYYPSGPQVDVPLSTVTNGGWVLCWSGSYYSAGSSIAQIQAGTASGSVSACDGSKVLLTGWMNSDPATLPVLAAAPTSDVFALTPENVPTLSNGSYWYHTAGRGIGFSPNATILQNTCDIAGYDFQQPGYNGDGTQAQRFCWHLDGDDTLVEGWSVGNNVFLQTGDFRGSGAPATRAIFKQLSSLHKGSKTNAGTLARVLKVTTPAGGSLVVSVSDASSGACRVDGNKLFAFGAGACEVTVTSLKANGDTKTAKSRTYLVN